MKLTLLLIPILFLSSCSIDWNDEKDKKVEELQKQIEETNKKINENSKDIDLGTKKLNFENDLKCQDKATELKRTANNIIAGYYNAEENKCYLKVFNKESNSIDEGPIDTFGPENIIPKEQTLQDNTNQDYYSWFIMQDVNLRSSPSPSANIIRPIIKGETVSVISNITNSNGKWYNITTKNQETGWISEVGFQKNDNVKSAADQN